MDAKISFSVGFYDLHLFYGIVRKIASLQLPLHYFNQHLNEKIWDPLKQLGKQCDSI